MKVVRSTPMPLLGRSRTWPIDAFTTKPSPRYLLIVFALAGDSTITRVLPLGLAIRAAAVVLLRVLAALLVAGSPRSVRPGLAFNPITGRNIPDASSGGAGLN